MARLVRRTLRLGMGALGCIGALWVSAGCERAHVDAKQVSTAPAPRAPKTDAPVRATPLAVGEVAFDVEALAHFGRRFRLSEFSQLPLVVYFCPDISHPECTAATDSLRDSWLALQGQIGMALGVVPAPTLVLRQYATKHKLSHVLIADAKGRVRSSFGVHPGVSSAYLLSPKLEVLEVFAGLDGALAQHVVSALQQRGLIHPPLPQ